MGFTYITMRPVDRTRGACHLEIARFDWFVRIEIVAIEIVPFVRRRTTSDDIGHSDTRS